MYFVSIRMRSSSLRIQPPPCDGVVCLTPAADSTVLSPRSVPPQPSRTMNRSTRAGFTLIEMLAVVALIGVVITFAVPKMATILQGSQMSQAAQQLNDNL